MQLFRNEDFHGFVEGLIKTIELRDQYTSLLTQSIPDMIYCRKKAMILIDLNFYQKS